VRISIAIMNRGTPVSTVAAAPPATMSGDEPTDMRRVSECAIRNSFVCRRQCSRGVPTPVQPTVPRFEINLTANGGVIMDTKKVQLNFKKFTVI